MNALARVGHIFPRNPVVDTVRTAVRLRATPEDVWRGMLFYEEVPGRPAPLLRWFLPLPVRTEGEKTRVGSRIRCTYEGGSLEKRITSSEPAGFVGFEVVRQDLGIEACISMNDGSYEIRPAEDGTTEVTLTTRYRGHLRPRWLWRPFESYLAHRMHDHILDGMRLLVESSTTSRVPALPKDARALNA